MKKTPPFLFPSLLILLLGSCQVQAGESSSQTSSSDEEKGLASLDPSYSSSVKNYLKTLIKAHNYTLEEEVTSSASSLKNEATSYYGEDFYYYDANYTLPYGYLRCEDGVYRVHESEGKLIGGELLQEEGGELFKTLWNQRFFYSFADLDEASVEAMKADGTSSVPITGKKNRLALLDLLGLGSSYYASIVSFCGSVSSDHALSLDLKVSDSSSGALISVKASVRNLLHTASSKIESYRKSHSYFVPDEDFAKARALMKGNNYTHYYSDEEDEEKIVGTEYFNEDYYFVEWDRDYAAKMASENTAILYSTGLIGIRDKKIKDSSGTYHALNGSYLISYNGSSFSVNLTNYYNESPDIPSVYSYPSLLQMWDEAELFEETEVEGLDKAFLTDDNNLIEDFVEMFFLTDSVSGVITESLCLGWKGLGSEDEQMIRFTLETTGGELSYEFYHFGSTFLPALDLFLEDLE